MGKLCSETAELREQQQLKIALIIQHFPPYIAGAERQAEFLARLLQASFGKCDVITTKFRPELPGVTNDSGVRIVRLPTSRIRSLKPYVNLVVSFVYLLFSRGSYDVIHCHCLSPFVLGAVLAGKIRGIKSIVKVSTTGIDGEIQIVKRRFSGSFLLWLFFRADTFVASTNTVFRELQNEGIAGDKIIVLPNMVDVRNSSVNFEDRSTMRRTLGVPDRITFLFAGRLVPEKGIDLMKKAWEIFLEEFDGNLLIVGDGVLRDELTTWEKTPRVRGTVRMFGWQQDPGPFYRASDVFVIPSKSEAFGNVIAEAMAHGLAIITTSVGLAQFWIRSDENGIIIQPNPNELASQMCRLAKETGLTEELGKRAKLDAARLFSPEVVLPQYLALYEKLKSARP